MKKGNYILWLPSWYPNKYAPYNGDFIQRHARAASAFVPVTVFHFVQEGGAENLSLKSEEVRTNGNLTEAIFYHEHKPVGIHAIDKLLFNLRFYQQAKQRLKQHFESFGLPLGVHVHVPVKAGNLAIWIEKEWGIPYMVSEHSSHYLPASPDAFFKKSIFYRWQVKRIFRKAKSVTNVSATIGKKIQHLFDLKPVTTIHNLVDTNIFFYQAVQPEVFTFIHVSSLTEQKNITGMLNAFQHLAKTKYNWQLKLVGPLTASLQKHVTALGLQDKVSFTGEIPYEQVAAQMQTANAFVLFSRHENFPCVVVEALCCGLPIVAADVAGVKEAVNEKNGILVKEGDEAGLAAALEQLILHYEKYERAGIAASAATSYNAGEIGRQIFNLYKANFGVGQ